MPGLLVTNFVEQRCPAGRGRGVNMPAGMTNPDARLGAVPPDDGGDARRKKKEKKEKKEKKAKKTK